MTDLENIAKKHDTDKVNDHNYIKVYEKYFITSRNKEISLFEVGVGGYHDPKSGGNSLKVWEEYFPNGKIYAIDMFDKSPLQTNKTKIFKCSQTDKFALEKIFQNIGDVDFIIDDGSHQSRDIIKTFEYTFKFLKNGGYYFIEDIQTSYWSGYQGDSFYLKKEKTAINYFKKIIDKINYQEFDNPFYKADYFSKNITEIHFYHNLIVVKKEINDELSNIVKNNMLPIKKKNFYKIRLFLRYSKYILRYIKYFYNTLLDKIKL